jgi:hypothetical protein
VADTPAALSPIVDGLDDVDGYLSRTSKYREPTLRETMAELDRVSNPDTPIVAARTLQTCEKHGGKFYTFCGQCAYEQENAE